MVIIRGKQNESVYQGCQIIKKLAFQDNDQNKVFYDNNGNLTFLGTISENKKIQWKNLYTGSIAEDEVYADKLYIDRNGVQQYRGEFVSEKRCDEGEVIYVDLNLEQLREGQGSYKDFMFYVTQSSAIDSIRKMEKNGVLYDFSESDQIQKWGAFSRIRAHCFNGMDRNSLYIEKFKKRLEIERQNCIKLNDGEMKFAYCPDEQKIIFKNRMIPVDCEKVCQPAICCRADRIAKKPISLGKSIISILERNGHVYLEPFSLQEELPELKVVVIASRQVELEIFDDEAQEWRKLEQKKFSEIKRGQQIQLRICANYADRVHEVALVV